VRNFTEGDNWDPFLLGNAGNLVGELTCGAGVDDLLTVAPSPVSDQ